MENTLPPLFISSMNARFTPAVLAGAHAAGLGNLTGGAWPSANRAILIPFTVPFRYPVRRMFVCSTNTTGNFDVGLYTYDYTKIYSSGTVALANAVTYTTLSPEIILKPDAYFMALALSSTGSVLRSTTFLGGLRYEGAVQMDSAFNLPATITPAAISVSYWPLFGITQLASGF